MERKFKVWKKKYQLSDELMDKVIEDYQKDERYCGGCDRPYKDGGWNGKPLYKCIHFYAGEYSGFICRGCSMRYAPNN